MESKLINFELELKFATKIHKLIYNKIFNSEIFLPWQSDLEYKLLGVDILVNKLSCKIIYFTGKFINRITNMSPVYYQKKE